MENKMVDFYKQYLEPEKMESFEDLAEHSDIINRNIYLGDIMEDTGLAVESLLRYYNVLDSKMGLSIDERTPVKIWIDSNGGSLESAFTVCDAISMSETPIVTINQGRAYSAGALIFLHGHTRFAFPNSSFLLHEGSIGNSNQIDAHKFQNMSDFYKGQRKVMKDMVLQKTDIAEELYNDHAKDDWWITALEALELKITDFILDKDSYQLLICG